MEGPRVLTWLFRRGGCVAVWRHHAATRRVHTVLAGTPAGTCAAPTPGCSPQPRTLPFPLGGVAVLLPQTQSTCGVLPEPGPLPEPCDAGGRRRPQRRLHQAPARGGRGRRKLQLQCPPGEPDLPEDHRAARGSERAPTHATYVTCGWGGTRGLGTGRRGQDRVRPERLWGCRV